MSHVSVGMWAGGGAIRMCEVSGVGGRNGRSDRV